MNKHIDPKNVMKDETGSQASYHSLGQRSAKTAKTTMSVVQLRHQLLTLQEQHGDEEHDEVAEALYESGLASLADRDYIEAQKQFMLALTMYRALQENAEEDEETAALYPRYIAQTYQQLGIVYLAMSGRGNEARSAFSQALAIMQEIHASKQPHRELAELRYYLGIAHLSQPYGTDANTDATTAINHFNEAFRIYSEILNPESEHDEIADVRDQLGLAYQQRNEYDKAIRCHTEALTMFRTIFEDEPNHPKIAATYRNLGICYQNQHIYPHAIASFNASLTIYQMIHKDIVHLDIAQLRLYLAEVYHANSERDKAEAELDIAFTMSQALFIGKSDHPFRKKVQHLKTLLAQESGEKTPSDPSPLQQHGMFGNGEPRQRIVTEQQATRAAKPITQAITPPTFDNLLRIYKQKAGMFNAAGKIFKEEYRAKPEEVIKILKQRSQDNPGGAAELTLNYFNL